MTLLQRYGYAGVYTQKTKESMGAYGKMDGCAVSFSFLYRLGLSRRSTLPRARSVDLTRKIMHD